MEVFIVKIKPVITDNYESKYLNIRIDFVLNNNIEFVVGDSGTGKSFVWQIFNNDKAFDSSIETLNYTDINKAGEVIKNAEGKLIVIDNADLLLDSNIRKKIAFDTSNQYIIFGRNPDCLYLTKDNFKKVNVNGNTIELKNFFRKYRG